MPSENDLNPIGKVIKIPGSPSREEMEKRGYKFIKLSEKFEPNEKTNKKKSWGKFDD